MTIVIVGGGAAGHAAAKAYREHGGADTVLMVTDDDRRPYERPPLSKDLLRGEDVAIELDPIDVELIHGHAAALSPGCIELDDGSQLRFDSCLLATGAEPVRLFDGGLVLRSARDAETLRDTPGGSVAVVGTGFIGCEAAASLAMAGRAVTLYGMEDAPQAERLGAEVGARIAGWLEDLGVTLRLGESVDEPPGADVVLQAVGVKPRLSLADGLRTAGGICCDAGLRTSMPGVYAAGDACEAFNPSAGRALRVEHWGDALGQGEIAGRRLAGDESAVWDSVPGFWSTIGERTLKYAAWGDGHASCSFEDHGGGAWTAWYRDADGAVVGVLTHERDDDYERGQELIAA